MLLRAGDTPQATKARLQNEIEQDRIAKTLEPVVAEYNLRKLPTTLVDEIRWWAREPTPTAKIMKNVRVSWRVFPHSVHSPFGPGKKCVIHAEVSRGCTFRDRLRSGFPWTEENIPDFVRRREKTFAIRDIPLDAEPTCRWCTH